jgi:hypothetical protein
MRDRDEKGRGRKIEAKAHKKALFLHHAPSCIAALNCYDPDMDAQFLWCYSHAYAGEAVRVESANRWRSSTPAPLFTMIIDKRCDLIRPTYHAGRALPS